MTPEQQAAFVMAQAACALAEIAAMQAANQTVAATGIGSPPYQRSDFMELMSRYTIGHNDVIAFFTGH